MFMQFAAPNSDRHQLIAFLGAGILAQLARYGSILFRNCIFGSLHLGARHVSYNKTTEIERTIDEEECDAACRTKA